MQEMQIYGVSFDLVGKQPIVLLKTADGNKFLPIWIGHPEAAAILMKQLTEDPQPPSRRRPDARVSPASAGSPPPTYWASPIPVSGNTRRTLAAAQARKWRRGWDSNPRYGVTRMTI